MPRLPLAAFLEKPLPRKPPPGVLLLGGDAALREMCRQRLVDAVVPEGARAWAVKRLSAREAGADDLLREAQTLPMLAPVQVLVVSDAEAWERLGEESREELTARLKDYFASPAPFTVMVLEAARLDERMKLFKALAESLAVVDASLGDDPAVRIPAAAALARRMAGDAGAAIEPEAARDLAEMLDGELGAMRAELAKLAAYAGEGKRITRQAVDALVFAERKHTLWELTGVLAAGDRRRALRFLDRLLAEGQQAPAVVGALAWMYRKLIEAQELPAGAAPMQAVRALGVRKDTAEVILRAVKKTPRRKLLEGLEALYEADSQLKSGVADPRAVLEFTLTRLI